MMFLPFAPWFGLSAHEGGDGAEMVVARVNKIEKMFMGYS